MQPSGRRGAAFFGCLVAAGLHFAPATGAAAQAAPAAPEVAIPRFSDPNARLERPDLPPGRVIRWAAGDDYPPFHYIDADGQPAGFVVDLARAVCAELKIACTLQAWRWDALLDTIDKKQADVILAMVRPTPELRGRFAMSERVHQAAGRFVARADTAPADATPETLAGKTVAVVAGSAHEAYLKAFMPGVVLKAFDKADAARAAVKDGQADLAFGDAASQSFWLNGASSAACCRFVGGAFVDARYFGEGVGALMKPADDKLRQAIDYALQRLDENGVYAEIYLKHFPVGIW